MSRAEIERLYTDSKKPISATTKIILQEVGEIKANGDNGSEFFPLDFHLETDRVLVNPQGRAKLTGYLVNPLSANLAESIVLEIQPSPTYEIEKDSNMIRIDTLKAGEKKEVSFWLLPTEKQATVNVKATYYHDIRSKEHRQFFRNKVVFEFRGFLQPIDNPYVAGGPLMPASESLFVGREDIFTWIEMNLVGKTQPNVLILYGQRKMGKTSTLYQLASGQRGQIIREYPDSPIYPVYIDMQGLAGRDARGIFRYFGQQIVKVLNECGILVSPLLLKEDTYYNFDGFLDQVTKKLPDRGLLVLIMDEFEQLQESVERGQLETDIFSYLRSLMQHRAQLTFILVGTHQLKEMSQGYGSTLFHVGLNQEIVSLSREETEKLIREPVAPIVQYDDLAVERIWLATRGNPYFVQLICHEIISAMNLEGRKDKDVKIDDVKGIISEIVTGSDDHLRYLWSDESKRMEEERLVLATLAGTPEASEESMSRSEIITRLKSIAPDEVTINQALERLEAHRLISRRPIQRQVQSKQTESDGWEPTLSSQDYSYAISFDLFRQWIAQKHPLGSLLH